MAADELDRCRRLGKHARPCDLQLGQLSALRGDGGAVVRDHRRAREARRDDDFVLGWTKAERKEAAGERLALLAQDLMNPAAVLRGQEDARAVGALTDP